MPNSSGTIETLALELGTALKPLKELLGPQIFSQLGVELPREIGSDAALLAKLAAASSKAGELEPRIANLAAAITADSTANILASGVSLIAKIAELVTNVADVGTALHAAANPLPAPQRTALQDLAGKLATRALEFMAVGYLDERMPALTSTLSILGLVDIEAHPGESLEINHAPTNPVPRRFYLDRIPQLASHPDQHFQQIFKWGANDFDGTVLLEKAQALSERLGATAAIYQEPGSPPVLEAFVLSATVDKSVSPPGLKIELALPGAATFEDTVSFSDLWKGTVKVTASYEAGMEVKVRPPFAVNAKPPSGNVSLDLLLGLKAEKTEADPIIILGITGGTRLQARSIGGSVGVKANLGIAGGLVSPAVQLKIDDGKLAIDFSQGDGFIQKLLSGIHLEAPFTLAADWNPVDGLRLQGQGGVEVFLPLHLDLAVVVVNGLYFSIGFSGSVPLQIGLATQLTAKLGPLAAVVDRIGVRSDISFPASGGNLGLADIAFAFQPPRGVGLSVDAGVVKGGGFLYIDPDRGEYAGAIELSLFEIVTIKAIGLITTKMPDGSQGFSMLILMSVEFGTGIQLSFGFTLLAVGGLLGLNRTMNLQPLAEGVRTGAVNSIMFPKDVVANAPKIISDLRTIFPPREGIFLIGPMARIGWGTPTLISLSLGIIIEIPGNIAILGVLQVALPTADAALIMLQVNFVGAIEFDKKRIWFFAGLFESRIVFMSIEAEMGLLMAFGDDANFVISVGGFHPRFSPPPLPFPSPRRIEVSIANTPIYRIRIEGYFAITSNTAQFGARAELFFGLDEINVQGHIAFDALFQFSPFFFIIEISASLSVNVFGAGLFSVSVRGSLEGPSPYHIKGHGSISLLFWDVDVDFEETWGERRDTQLPPIAILPILTGELGKADNWRALPPPTANLLVSLRKMESAEAAMILHPLGTLQISQRAMPLELKLDKIGSQKPSDVNRVSLAVTGGGLGKKDDAFERFAPAQFQDFSDADKLSKPAFSKERSGIELSAGADLRSSKMVKRVVRYEEIIIDSNSKRFQRSFRDFIGVLFHFFANNGAISRCELSQSAKTKLQPFAEKIGVNGETYSVAFQANNKAVSAEAASFHSEASARDFMNRQIAADASLAETMHVIPQHELAA